MSGAVILDRGYRDYDGPRLGRRGAVGAVVREGIRRILGLRRKARRKVFPWSLVVVAGLSATILLGVHFVASRSPLEVDDLPRYGEYFDLISVVALLFVATAGPELLVPDRTQGVLSVYFSRPLSVSDYLLAKLAALGSLVLGFYLVPQTALHLGLAGLSRDGFLDYLGANLDVLWKVPAAAFVYFAVHAAVAFVIAAFAGRVGIAAGAYLGVMLVVSPLATALSTQVEFPGSRLVSLLAIESHPRVVRDWIFDITTAGYAPIEVGFRPWVSLAAATVLVAVAAVAVAWRYRRLA